MPTPAKHEMLSIDELIARGKKGYTHIEQLNPVLQKEVREALERAAIAEQTVSPEKLAALQARKLSTQHKVSAGLSGVCAVMAGCGALSAAQSSVRKDENGKSHIQYSQVAVALLQATLAAGCAYFAHEALQGRTVSF